MRTRWIAMTAGRRSENTTRQQQRGALTGHGRHATMSLAPTTRGWGRGGAWCGRGRRGRGLVMDGRNPRGVVGSTLSARNLRGLAFGVAWRLRRCLHRLPRCASNGRVKLHACRAGLRSARRATCRANPKQRVFRFSFLPASFLQRWSWGREYILGALSVLPSSRYLSKDHLSSRRPSFHPPLKLWPAGHLCCGTSRPPTFSDALCVGHPRIQLLLSLLSAALSKCHHPRRRAPLACSHHLALWNTVRI